MRVLFPLLAAALLAACDGGGPAVRLNTGDPAPAFSAPASTGGRLSFPEDLRGKPVVVRFWADWCRYCEGEMKSIEQVYRRRRDQGLSVVAVNVGQDEKTVDAFMRRIGVSYPALIDEEAGIARKYGVVALPTTYFVDARGVVRAKVLGEADESTFDNLAGKLLQ
jgi:cytochrome c biogenesis protein CcmG/thiol:disulfide interchange protein DsbE